MWTFFEKSSCALLGFLFFQNFRSKSLQFITAYMKCSTKPMKSKPKNLAIATATAAGAAPAVAAINFTSLDSALTADYSPSQAVYFSLKDGTASNANFTPSNDQFTLFHLSNNSTKPQISTSSGGGILVQGSYAANLSLGDTISSSGAFSSARYINNSGSNDANWGADTRGYLGLKFDNNGTDNYGWADVEYTSSQTLVLYGFAYEDSGAAIAAGAVPEPSSAALLAALAAGSAAMLRRRRAACVDA